MAYFDPTRPRLSQRALAALLALAIAGPFLALVVASFSFRWTWPALLPSEWWWQARDTARLPIGWDYVLSPQSHVARALATTVLIGVAVAILSLAIALPAARAIGRFRSVGLLLALPLVVPEIAIGLGTLLIFDRLGLAGTAAGVVLAHVVPTLPYSVLVLAAGFARLGPEYEEQARVLGARRTQVWRRILLPLLRPALIAGALMAFLVSANLFVLTFLVGRGQVETLPTLLFSAVGAGGALDAEAAGITLVACLPGLLLLVAVSAAYRRSLRSRP